MKRDEHDRFLGESVVAMVNLEQGGCENNNLNI